MPDYIFKILFFLSVFNGLIGVSGVNAAAQYPAVGIVLNIENDAPISYVQIFLKSGKLIGETDSRGKFDLYLESAKANLVFKKEGYSEEMINLSEIPDVLAIEVLFKANIKSLGTTKVIAEKRVLAKSRVQIEVLEAIQGLQFDLNEHLSKIPGVSAQKEFSKEISYNGSRTQDLSVAIGPIKIPHLRHVDIGFPGNTSVLNPSVFRDVQINSDNQGGSLDAGLAGRIEYTPKTGDPSHFAGSLRAGVIMREAVISGPMIGFDDFIMSFRYLDPFVLEKFGEKFFSQQVNSVGDTDEDLQSGDQSGQDWRLKAGDFYLHLSSTDEDQNATRSTLLYSWDDYEIEQQLDPGYATVLGRDRIPVFKGEQYHTVFSYEGAGADGFNYHLGYVLSKDQKVFYDTSAVRTDVSNINIDNLLLSDQDFEDEHYLMGISQVLDNPFLGARHTIAGEYEYWDESRSDKLHQTVNPSSLDHILKLQSHLKWRDASGQSTLQIGGWSSSDANVFSGSANLSTQRKKLLPFGSQLLGELALQSSPKHHIQDIKTLKLRAEENLHAQLGINWSNQGQALNVRAYARQYLNPEVPIPDVYWMYTPLNQANSAQVIGANLVYEWTQSPSYAWISNLSSTYGVYDNDITWEANRLIDMSNSLRIYPRQDSLLSLIFTHKVSLDQPTYIYLIDPLSAANNLKEAGPGTTIISNGQELDTYRTDVRLHLDLSSAGESLFLKNLRFYSEVNNVFNGFSFNGAKYFGGENIRQRGWTATSRKFSAGNDQNQLEPFWAPGMGLFVQLGFEGNFGG